MKTGNVSRSPDRSGLINHKQFLVKVLLIFSVFYFPLFASSQVPKAYDMVNYNSSLKGKLVKLHLADGYLGYSSISFYTASKKKPVKFEPAASGPDEQDRLKFITYQPGHHEFFVLDSLFETYETTLTIINGRFYSGRQTIKVTFRLARSRH